MNDSHILEPRFWAPWQCNVTLWNSIYPLGQNNVQFPGGEGYSKGIWVGGFDRFNETLTLFKIQNMQILLPCLRENLLNFWGVLFLKKKMESKIILFRHGMNSSCLVYQGTSQSQVGIKKALMFIVPALWTSPPKPLLICTDLPFPSLDTVVYQCDQVYKQYYFIMNCFCPTSAFITWTSHHHLPIWIQVNSGGLQERRKIDYCIPVTTALHKRVLEHPLVGGKVSHYVNDDNQPSLSGQCSFGPKGGRFRNSW